MSGIRKFFVLPPFEISPEREKEIIDNIADTVRRYGLELPALLFGSCLVPMSTILSQTTLLPLAPFFELAGVAGYEYTAFFSKKENVRRLLNRIEELKNAREGARF